MWRWRAAILLTYAALIIGIILYDRGWASREVSAAFNARFGNVPQLSFDPQHDRGEVCGSFKYSSKEQGRFVFVSHYSSGDDPEGLWLESDAVYLPVADKLCQKA